MDEENIFGYKIRGFSFRPNDKQMVRLIVSDKDPDVDKKRSIDFLFWAYHYSIVKKDSGTINIFPSKLRLDHFIIKFIFSYHTNLKQGMSFSAYTQAFSHSCTCMSASNAWSSVWACITFRGCSTPSCLSRQYWHTSTSGPRVKDLWIKLIFKLKGFGRARPKE